MQTNIEITRCPECGAKVSEVVRHNGFRVGGSSIGPSSIPCPGCGIHIVTEQSEWAEKSLLARAWFFLQLGIWTLVGSVFLAGALTILVYQVAVAYRFIKVSQQTNFGWVVYGLATGLIGLQLFRNAFREIRESRQRTEAEANSQLLR